MKKQNLTIVIVLIAVLALGATFLLKNVKSSGKNSSDSNAVEEVTKTEDGEDKSLGDVVKGTLNQILATGKSVKCTFSDLNSEPKTESTTYISGEKFRSDSRVENEDGNVTEFHMISDGTYAYAWDDVQKTGMKVNLSEFKNTEGEDKEGASNDILNIRDAMEKYNYTCKPWSVDQSQFSMPTDIEFTDLSEMMKDLKGMSKELCKQCDNMGDTEQISECRKGLQCDE